MKMAILNGSNSKAKASLKAAIDTRVRAFGFLLLVSALMNYVPKEEFGTYLFAGALAVYVVFVVFAKQITFADRRTKSGFALVLLCVVSVINLVANGLGIYEWFRAIVPFTFFLILLYLPRLNENERRWLAKMLFFACALWLAKILIEAFVLAAGGSDVFSVRLTFRVIDAVLPFPLVAVPYLLFADHKMGNLVRWGLLTVFLYTYVWIGYRVGLLLMGGVLTLYVLTNLRSVSVVQLGFLALVAIALVFSGTFNNFSLVERFELLSAAGDTSRTLEWIYAIEQFRSSPLYGMGLGWQVPASITYYGVDAELGGESATVGYVHSSVAYFGMNLGTLGLLAYLMTVMPGIPSRRTDSLFFFSSVSLGLLLLFGTTQASFRLIQTVLMTVALIKINAMPTSNVTTSLRRLSHPRDNI